MKVVFGYMQGFGRDAARHVSTFARMVCVHPETKKSGMCKDYYKHNEILMRLH